MSRRTSRGPRIAAAVIAVAALAAAVPAAASRGGAPGQDAFEAGVAAYRAGDHARAGELWEEALAEPLAAEERARVLYDLGNAAWRDGRRGEALGWWNACLRIAPRHADARANVTFAREELGLPPADPGDLQTALRVGLESWTRGEAALAVIAASLLLLGAILLEALRGGRAARWSVGVSAVLVALAAAPWIHAERRARRDPWLAIGVPEVGLRAEPRPTLPVIATVATGEEVEKLDELAGQVRVRTSDGTRGWADAEAFFRLRVGR
jgi:tetratricopeptide (TPR) repeat protein